MRVVESYNPLSNQWVQRPPLNKKKGSIAGASIHGKIYAIGGGNGVECFAEVELFDINVARWMPTRSMLEKVCKILIYGSTCETNCIQYFEFIVYLFALGLNVLLPYEEQDYLVKYFIVIKYS